MATSIKIQAMKTEARENLNSAIHMARASISYAGRGDENMLDILKQRTLNDVNMFFDILESVCKEA